MFVFWVWTCAADLDQYTGPIKILKKWNKFQEISFYTSLPKIMIVCYAVPEICCVIDSYLFWAIFSTFTPLTAWKIKIEKKKTPGDIIILHKCTKNHDYMLYCSWDMARDRCNCYFSFWAIFLPFYSSNSPKNQILKKIFKKCLEISSFYTGISKIMIRWCMVPEIWCVADRWTDGQTDRKSDI